MEFTGSHIISVSQFDRNAIERVFEVARHMQTYASRRKVTRALEGAILGNMFFEPSTRTRISFGSAFNLLGGAVRETTEISASSLTKGESLQDTARVLSGYTDVIVMRHAAAGAVAEFADESQVPVINAGDGANEHPSQALLDLFTIHKELGGASIDGLRISLLGDLKYGRSVHSLVRLLCLYDDITIKLVSPPELRLPDAYVGALQDAGHEVVISDSMHEGVRDSRIVYVTRIQEERIPDKAEAASYRGLFRFNQAIYTQNCQPNTVIMHPLPRDASAGEISVDLNENPNLAIFRQTENGVVIRMALFALILDVVEQVDTRQRMVNWFTEKRFQEP